MLEQFHTVTSVPQLQARYLHPLSVRVYTSCLESLFEYWAEVFIEEINSPSGTGSIADTLERQKYYGHNLKNGTI